MRFLKQTWALVKKDLLVVLYRRWLSTLIRALILPIVFTVILCEVKNWTATPGVYGVGKSSPIRSLSDAFAIGGKARPKIIIIDRGIKDGDIGQAVTSLSAVITRAGAELHVVPDSSQLRSICPSSNKGVSDCFGAVQFDASPLHGGTWNYTVYGDAGLGLNIDVTRDDNDVQLYQLPFQREIDNAIAQTNGGQGLTRQVSQYPYTTVSEEKKRQEDLKDFQGLVLEVLAFAFFIGLSGLAYHLTGHVCHQRERGNLELIDSMMPNRSRWECIIARALSTHIAFDIIYLPGWIVMGVLLPIIVFPRTSVGAFVALYILGGLALTSYSLLASSLFRKVQISGSCAIIAALVFALVAQFAVQLYDNGQAGVYATGILFPPSAYVFFLLQAARSELLNQSLNLATINRYYGASRLPGAAYLGFFVFQIVVYPVLAVVIEKYLHCNSTRSRTLKKGENMGGVAVKLRNFSKHYRNLKDKKKTVKAVDDLTLDIHAGSITVLLGANGSGKSTTLNAIAGMESVTSGSIEIDGTGGLGICPQKNVMWDLMTVKEHVNFFNNLKNPNAGPRKVRRDEVDRIIAGCDLAIKKDALSKTLSGGQKRKLQLAMMLAGGSKVCCIDEASSGVDPLARRKIWDILLAERGQRSLLFTTHFLDEAEGLADHVAILSKGVLKAQGSVAGLKSRLGGDYQVVFPNKEDAMSIPVPSQIASHSDYNHTVFDMPDSSLLADLVSALEKRDITNYRIEGPTMEKVFLSLAQEMQGDSDLARELKIAEKEDIDPHGDSLAVTPIGVNRGLNLATGRGVSPFKQTGILFLKRVIILRHNYMPYIAALFVPLVVAGMVTRFFRDPSFRYGGGIPCADPSGANPYNTGVYRSRPFQFSSSGFVWGPPDRLSASTLQAAIPNDTSSRFSSSAYYNVTTSPKVNTLQGFNRYVAANATNLYWGGLFDDENDPTFAWRAPSVNSGADVMATQSVLNGVLMNQTLYFAYSSFKRSFNPFDSTTTLVALFTILGFAIYPGFFALYPTAERIRNVRAMQYSNGILSSSVWAAHALFDLCFVTMVSVITIAIWVSLWGGWYAPGYMFVCFFLYGLAATAFSYIVSLFVTSQLAAFAFTAVIQVIIAILYFLGYVISSANAPPTMTYQYFNYIHYTIGLISPAANLERALFMTLNQYALICRGTEKASYPGEIGIYGAPIVYLICQFLVLSAFLMFWESGRSLEVFGIRRNRQGKKAQHKDPEKTAAICGQHADAVESIQRLSPANDGLCVENVSKSFGSNLAVEDVTFGILPSEKFALLGPNGAGKSTIISLIRGDLNPKHIAGGSSIVIGGDDLQKSPVAAKNHLGVCPQFDAVDSMTLLEHLRFYARARGVPDREANIQELITRLGLQEHKNKLARKLSGGTKRKLSLAIALISNPGVLLLDEPSSGMDPAAKRALWSTLSAISEGRVLLITTHSMEEADALCDRAGIMASRLLALGSVDELRERHGNAAVVHLVHKDAPHTSTQDMAAMNRWVQAVFPDAVMEQKNFGGQMRFSVPRSAKTNQEVDKVGSGWNTARLFKVIEEVKIEIGVGDYSIGPATLDQVFLNVVRKHKVQEENTKREGRDLKGVMRAVFR